MSSVDDSSIGALANKLTVVCTVHCALVCVCMLGSLPLRAGAHTGR